MGIEILKKLHTNALIGIFGGGERGGKHSETDNA